MAYCRRLLVMWRCLVRNVSHVVLFYLKISGHTWGGQSLAGDLRLGGNDELIARPT